MNIDHIKSDLKMRNLHFPECSVKRQMRIVDEHLDIDVSRVIEKHTDSEYVVTLKTSVTKAARDLEVCVIARALFSVDCSDSELVSELLRTNSVAIMFPFVRSQISLLTTQPGLSPVVLPPINTARLSMETE